MPRQLGPRLFTFAAVTDTHVNFGEHRCNSEFEINLRANARMRHVVRDLNRRDLAFVVHLGDLVHPVPALADLYEQAAGRFREEVSALRHPLHLVPGNHDIGDKPLVWGPAGVVCEAFIALWRKNFGPNFHAFDYGACRFYVVDAQVINSGLAAEAEQRDWLEADMARAAGEGRRIFVNTHYPPFLTDAEEDEHFDNIAEPGRSWLLGLLARHGAEALFCGHVHNVWYNRHGVTDCYTLPSTAFVRQDYAEMYRVAPPPATDGGRADLAKLGYFLVHVHARGHVCKWIRTFGTIAEPGSALPDPGERIDPVHPLENPNARFGFDMRQNWLETIEIPPSGSLDEFDRKRTRNDYPLMALLEMGVRRVRIPARDLLDVDHRRRLDDCARQGIAFTLFSFGVPGERLLRAVAGADGIVDCWEIGDAVEALPAAIGAARDAGVALYASKIRTKEDVEGGGGVYHHMISHGFTPADGTQIAALAGLDGLTGLVFRVDGATSPWRARREALAACRDHGLRASLHVRMTTGKPGEIADDDEWAAGRIAEALCTAAANRDLHVYADTFADVDRGYFRRHGAVDRFYNPRPAFHVVRHLNAALAGALGEAANGCLAPGSDERGVTLVDGRNRHYRLARADGIPGAPSPPESTVMIDLLSGERLPAGTTTDASRPRPSVLWISDD